MRILFTSGETVLSKAIRGVTGEPVSHCALSFEFGLVEFIIHANLLGVHIELGSNFRKHSHIIHDICLDKPEAFQNTKDRAKLIKLLEQYEMSFYDFGALFFIGFALLARKYLRIPLPKSNLWQSSGMFLCDEWIQLYVDGKINSMITPYQLYQELVATGDWREYDASKEL